MSSAATLPADWAHVLDEMHLRLDHAIAATDKRLADAPIVDVHALAAERRQEIQRWSERLKLLSSYLDSTEQFVQSADDVLLREERILREQLAQTALLRQKVAQATGRAIG